MPRLTLTYLEPAKLIDSFLDGFEFFDYRVHGVLLEIHLLGKRKHLRSQRARHHNDAIGVCDDNVSGMDFNSVTNDTNIRSRETVVPDRSGRHDPQRVHGKTDLLQVSNIAHSAINDRAGKVERGHRRSHQAA